MIPAASTFAFFRCPALARSILRTVAAALVLALDIGGGATAAVARSAVYLSPTGNDRADGRTPATALRSFARAQAALDARTADTVYLTGGTFRTNDEIRIRGTAPGQVWAAAPGARPLIDGGGRKGQLMLVTGDGVTIADLRFANIRGNGIVIGDAANITIRGNTLTDVDSDGWTQGAIIAVQNARNVTITGNTIRNTSYVGIGFFGSEAANLSGARITGNRVTASCRKIADCGAIYIAGRTATANGVVIRGNTIADYGPAGNETKAIYLDDGLSGATVSHNTISGRGTYPLQIHGGSGNTITANDIRLEPGQKLIFHQMLGSRAMRGNQMTGNIVRVAPGGTAAAKYGGPPTGLMLGGNRILSN